MRVHVYLRVKTVSHVCVLFRTNERKTPRRRFECRRATSKKHTPEGVNEFGSFGTRSFRKMYIGQIFAFPVAGESMRKKETKKKHTAKDGDRMV